MFWKMETTKFRIQNFEIDAEKLSISGKEIDAKISNASQRKKYQVANEFFRF